MLADFGALVSKMVTIKPLQKLDIDHIKKLHEKYYSQFEFPDFFNRFLVNFKIIDENEEIIIAGGVRPIAETIIVTDQTKSRTKIGRALVEAQRFSMYACGRYNIDELHAFIDDMQYAKHLERHGFSERSKAYSIKVL